jgi:hypothetical protein
MMIQISIAEAKGRYREGRDATMVSSRYGRQNARQHRAPGSDFFS